MEGNQERGGQIIIENSMGLWEELVRYIGIEKLFGYEPLPIPEEIASRKQRLKEDIKWLGSPKSEDKINLQLDQVIGSDVARSADKKLRDGIEGDQPNQNDVSNFDSAQPQLHIEPLPDIDIPVCDLELDSQDESSSIQFTLKDMQKSQASRNLINLDIENESSLDVSSYKSDINFENERKLNNKRAIKNRRDNIGDINPKDKSQLNLPQSNLQKPHVRSFAELSNENNIQMEERVVISNFDVQTSKDRIPRFNNISQFSNLKTKTRGSVIQGGIVCQPKNSQLSDMRSSRFSRKKEQSNVKIAKL